MKKESDNDKNEQMGKEREVIQPKTLRFDTESLESLDIKNLENQEKELEDTLQMPLELIKAIAKSVKDSGPNGTFIFNNLKTPKKQKKFSTVTRVSIVTAILVICGLLIAESGTIKDYFSGVVTNQVNQVNNSFTLPENVEDALMDSTEGDAKQDVEKVEEEDVVFDDQNTISAILAEGDAEEQQEAANKKKIADFIAKYHISGAEANKLSETIIKYANNFNVDPFILSAIIAAESSYNARATGRNGKIGLLQIPPKLAIQVTKNNSIESSTNDLTNVDTNLTLGLHYLNELHGKYNGNFKRTMTAFDMKGSEGKANSGTYLHNIEWVYTLLTGGDSSRLHTRFKNSFGKVVVKKPVFAKLKEISSAKVQSKNLNTKLASVLDSKIHNKDKSILINQIITENSQKYNFDPLFVAAVIMARSNFNTNLVSKNGNVGLLQLSPKIIKEFASSADVVMPKSLVNPVDNLTIGIHYLSYCFLNFDDFNSAMSAFAFGTIKTEQALLLDTFPPQFESYIENVNKQIRKLGARIPVKNGNDFTYK